jgi:hypothetical protein
MTDKSTLGRLESVELRTAWQNEAGDFTPWLANADNISLLGETIGLELEVEAEEKPVGPFRADILCKDTASQDWVLVENQLERTDHTHLGQLMTYAAGLHAATIVWVAAKVRDEHRAALDWLNEITSDDFAFFGLEVELWKIGESPAAPKFNVVCKPNDWTRSVTTAAKNAGNGASSETKNIQLTYWTAFRELMISEHGAVNPTKAHAEGWMSFSLGKSGIWLEAVMRIRDQRIGVNLNIGTGNSLAYFKLLEQDRGQYEKRFGEKIEWLEKEGMKQKQVRTSLGDVDPTDEQDWPRQHKWIYDKLERFHSTFSSAVKQLDPDDFHPEEAPQQDV